MLAPEKLFKTQSIDDKTLVTNSNKTHNSKSQFDKLQMPQKSFYRDDICNGHQLRNIRFAQIVNYPQAIKRAPMQRKCISQERENCMAKEPYNILHVES